MGNCSRERNWLFAIDESGSRSTEFFGYGALILDWNRRGDLDASIRGVRETFGFYNEAKWNKVNRRSYEFMAALIDMFLEHSWLAFHCLVFKKSELVKKLIGGRLDSSYQKLLTQFVTNKSGLALKREPRNHHVVRVWVDPIQSAYAKADEVVEIIGGHMLNRRAGEACRIKYVKTRDSKETPAIQLCDLLLGAVVTSWNNTSQPGSKKWELREYLATRLGWPDLLADTFPSQKKFNIWRLHDVGTHREVTTRVIRPSVF